MFTGRWAHELSANYTSPLDGAHPTLAEHLGAHGYTSAGFAANLGYCSHETGLGRGFHHYEDYSAIAGPDRLEFHARPDDRRQLPASGLAAQ